MIAFVGGHMGLQTLTMSLVSSSSALLLLLLVVVVLLLLLLLLSFGDWLCAYWSV